MSRAASTILFAGILGGLIGEIVAAPAIVIAVDRGAPTWLLWILAAPLLLPTVVIAIAAKLESRRLVAAAAPDWQVYDEELPELPSPIELAMERRSRANVADAWVRRPTSLAGTPAVLTRRQREDAEDDAMWKRYNDGLGDE